MNTSAHSDVTSKHREMSVDLFGGHLQRFQFLNVLILRHLLIVVPLHSIESVRFCFHDRV